MDAYTHGRSDGSLAARALFDALDVNKDGVLSREEFASMANPAQAIASPFLSSGGLQDKDTAPLSPKKGRLKMPRALPFLGLGRISDGVVIASYRVAGQATQAADDFGRLLLAARVKLKAGQRIRLDGPDESIFVLIEPSGTVMAALVACADYLEATAYQLLADFVVHALQVGSLSGVGADRLTDHLEPVVESLMEVYSSAWKRQSRKSSSGGQQAHVLIDQKVEVEAEGKWYAAIVKQMNDDGTCRVVYDVNKSFEDVEQQHIRALTPKAPAGSEKELLFCALGRVVDTTTLGYFNVGNRVAESLDLFQRLLTACKVKLKPGQQVALENGGVGTVFVSVAQDGCLMSAVMTASAEYPDAAAYQLLQELLDYSSRCCGADVGPSQHPNPATAQQRAHGLAQTLQAQMHELFAKYRAPSASSLLSRSLEKQGSPNSQPSGPSPLGGQSPRSATLPAQRRRSGDLGESPRPAAPRPLSSRLQSQSSFGNKSPRAGGEESPRRVEEVHVSEEVEALRKLIAGDDMERLRQAIATAELIPAEELREAQRAIRIEGDFFKCTDELEQAAQCRDIKLLQEVIFRAEACLAEAQSGSPTQMFAFRKGCAVPPRPQRFNARLEAVMDGARAVLAEEQRRAHVQEELLRASNVKDVERLKAAIKASERIEMPSAELCHAIEQARLILQEQASLLATVRRALQSREAFMQFCEVDMEDMAAMHKARKKFRDATPLLVQLGADAAIIDDLEAHRKKVHNRVQDLRGSVRVFCRIRPMSERERRQGDANVIERVDCMSVKVMTSTSRRKGAEEFVFDSVFMPESTQEEVFADTKDLVQSALDGYNVAIFAYGQTGSGKTYTMAGVPGNEGLSFRTIDEIYHSIERKKSRFECTVEASMLELYKQDLVDLLSKGMPLEREEPYRQRLRIRTEKTGAVFVEGATFEECRDAGELKDLVDRGTCQRAVAATMMNSESSRSHLLLTIGIDCIHRETREVLKGKIMIVDLAGSERLKKSGCVGCEKKESIEINKALTALGDVIEGLTKGSTCIPYRNHKLTELMQDVLGGSAKTIMFAHCSPASSNLEETLMSLKYATRAKRITNKIRRF